MTAEVVATAPWFGAAVRRWDVPALMRNTIRGYDWGCRHALARLQGRDAATSPEAELWMGAHPSGPSVLLDADGAELTLDAAIAHDPVGVLGQECVERFGARLPFLVKVLAVRRALSIQVHPTPEQARDGFDREDVLGVARDAPHRVYGDPWAKPEMLYAVTAFEALAGMRDARQAGYLVDLLDAPRLVQVRARLGGADDARTALELLVSWPQDDREALVAEIVAGAERAVPTVPPGSPTSAALEWVLRLCRQHPRDPLVVGPLLMHLHRLDPGDTLFVPAGMPHAYLSGVGVEIMSSSDNVVRAGLTSKHVDSGALLELLDPQVAPLVDVPAQVLDGGEVVYRPPAEEFELGRTIVAGEVRLAGPCTGPQVLLCLGGEVQVWTGEHHVVLTGGQSAFLGAQTSDVRLRGGGEVFRARIRQP